MIEAGINYLAVSSLEEALEIRKINKEIPILIFGNTSKEEALIAIENNLTVSIISYEDYLEIKDIKNLKCHIKLNTGMNRVGINKKSHVEEIVNNKTIEIEGIYTHFATSGVKDIYFDKQVEKFFKLTSKINLKKIKIVHLYNSLSLVRHEKISIANGVRLGIIMYGFSASMNNPKGIKKIKFNILKKIKTNFKTISNTNLKNNLKLNKVLSLHSEVIYINKINKKSIVGYNALYKAKKEEIIATLPIGTADGVTTNFKYVNINKKRYDIVSTTMDYTMVRIDNKVKLHDKVDLINEKLSVARIAKNSNFGLQQMLCSLSTRLIRVNVKEKKQTEYKY